MNIDINPAKIEAERTELKELVLNNKSDDLDPVTRAEAWLRLAELAEETETLHSAATIASGYLKLAALRP